MTTTQRPELTLCHLERKQAVALTVAGIERFEDPDGRGFQPDTLTIEWLCQPTQGPSLADRGWRLTRASLSGLLVPFYFIRGRYTWYADDDPRCGKPQRLPKLSTAPTWVQDEVLLYWPAS